MVNRGLVKEESNNSVYESNKSTYSCRSHRELTACPSPLDSQKPQQTLSVALDELSKSPSHCVLSSPVLPSTASLCKWNASCWSNVPATCHSQIPSPASGQCQSQVQVWEPEGEGERESNSLMYTHRSRWNKLSWERSHLRGGEGHGPTASSHCRVWATAKM